MDSRATPSPFAILCREFFAQFVTSESVASEAHTRQALAAVLAFLFAPGLILLIALFPEYNAAVIHVRRLGAPPGIVDDLLEWIMFLFSTYSMLAVGIVTVSAWDALVFDRRDAMVLGPLPIRGTTLVGAKLMALAAFLLVTATAVNLLYAIVFAMETSDQLGAAVLVKHFLAYLVTTVSAATFLFAAIVTLRGLVLLLAGARLAASLGSLLQFGFVIALLSLVFLSPAVWQTRLMTARFTDWMPTAWYVGLFERLRGSPRMIQPEFVTLAFRAAVATPLAVVTAIAVSVVGFRRQMQLAIAPSASTGLLGGASLVRTLACWMAGPSCVGRATADFILCTIVRNRAQQAPIAINAAVGAAIVIAALSRNARNLASLMQLRTAVLWIPLVGVYWATIGIRAAFLVPSELSAAWTFRLNAPDDPPAFWSAVRASMMALVMPAAVVVALATVGPLVGWRVAAWHVLFVVAMTTVLVQAAALTVTHVPFTRPYRPGHAKLKTRWPLYIIGLLLCAYWPTRWELTLLQNSAAMMRAVGGLAAVLAGLEVVGRRLAHARWAASPPAVGDDADDDDVSSVIVLGIGGAARKAAGIALLTVLAGAASGCGPAVNLAAGLQVESASTGWLDVTAGGRDKVVPALSLKLKNVSNQRLRVLLVNAHFHSADDVEEWGTGFLTAAGSEGLAPGATTGTIVLKGEYGYTGAGVQRMIDKFVETKVDLFVKYGAERWTPVGEYTVPRQLMSAR